MKPALVLPSTAALPGDSLRAEDTSGNRRARPWQAAGWGLLITLGQILSACLLSGAGDVRTAYLSLHQWDSNYYQDIAEHGYHITLPPGPADVGNLAFFPGYPLFARLLARALGLASPFNLLVAAQLGCWGFWTYFLLFCQRWRLPGALAALGVGMVLVHPASFFLVAGYSEPLFLMALLGFFYWTDADTRWGWPLAALHGFVMTATRIVGLPLVLYPLLRLWLNRARSADPSGQRGEWGVAAGLVVALTASLGGLLFFAYCQARFGQWDLYARSQEWGWSVRPNYLAFLSGKLFHFHLRLDRDFGDPEALSRLTVPATLLVFAVLLGFEVKLARAVVDSGWRRRLGLYLCALALFYVPLAGHYSRNFSSMSRFTLCVQAPLTLAALQLLRQAVPPTGWRRWVLLLPATWALVSLMFQIALTYRFVHGLWVA
jgi:hypothetical protein